MHSRRRYSTFLKRPLLLPFTQWVNTNIFFANRQLQQCFEDYTRAERRWGIAVAKKFIQRVSWIQDTRDFNDLRRMRSFRLPQLSGPLTGQFAIDLNKSWRLTLTHDEDEKSVRILEVTNHYDD